MAEAAVTIQDVHKNYGTIQALHGISITIPPGQIFGLLGANGAGKSTLMRTLVGSTQPSKGQVQVLGLHPQRDKHQLRRLIGYMPQQAALYQDLSARANIQFFAQAHDLPMLAARVDAVLDFVDLTERQHDAVFKFSGGMKQRVSLACALVHQPRILLLDEPTAGVDPKLREAFWHHFRTLAAQGVTILVSTHQMDEAFHCDQLAIMRGGQVLATGTPQEIMQRGQSRVQIHHAGKVETHTLHNVSNQLPRLLQSYDLAQVERIDIEAASMEAVILQLISEATPQENLEQSA